MIAHLTDDGTITATKFTNDLQPVSHGEARVAERHAANAPEVDILVSVNQQDVPLLTDISNGDQGKATVPAGNYDVAIDAGAGGTVGPVSATLEENVNTVVYAVGSLDSGGFELLYQNFDL